VTTTRSLQVLYSRVLQSEWRHCQRR